MSVVEAAFESRLVPFSLGQRFRYSRHSAEFAIQQMVRFHESTALSLMCVDAGSGVVLATTDEDFVPMLPADVFSQLVDGPLPKVIDAKCGLTFYAVPLADLDDLPTLGIGYVLNHVGRASEELLACAGELGWQPHELAVWASQQKACSSEVLKLVLRTYCEHDRRDLQHSREVSRQQRRAERVAEQIQLLHRLLAQLSISQNTGALNDACLAGLQQMTSCLGCALIWEQSAQRRLEIKHGDMPVSFTRLPLLIERCTDDAQFDAVIQPRVAGTLLGADFPGVQNLLVNPIREGARVTGWVCLFNRATQTEFDDTDIVLAETIATLIVTHARNREVYEAHDDLLLQFVGSLVTTIDAKDSYTRGHSERVAEVSRCLARQLGLSERDLDDCFNAGLLHDIGKIGVNDAILQKTDALTSEEYEHVKQHPMIGYRILRGLKSMHRLLPGVRNHHEEYAGSGYPDRLAGNEIPLLARILAVADSYDAMRSDRPYRKGMPLSQVEHIFRNGSGQQWDPDVIAAYFEARDEIRKIGGPEIWSDD